MIYEMSSYTKKAGWSSHESITQLIKSPTDPKYGSSLVNQQKSNWTRAGAGTGKGRGGELVESSYHHDMRLTISRLGTLA